MMFVVVFHPTTNIKLEISKLKMCMWPWHDMAKQLETNKSDE